MTSFVFPGPSCVFVSLNFQTFCLVSRPVKVSIETENKTKNLALNISAICMPCVIKQSKFIIIVDNGSEAALARWDSLIHVIHISRLS